MKREPAAIIGAAVAAISGLLVLIGHEALPDNAAETLVAAFAIFAPVVQGLVTRFKVWAPASVDDKLDAEVAAAKRYLI